MHSETLDDHFQNPRNVGELARPDAVGTAGVPGQGNYLVLQLGLLDGIISEARYRCHGCGPTIAAGSGLTTLVLGCAPEDCALIDGAALAGALGGLPPGKERCVGLAAEALRRALRLLG